MIVFSSVWGTGRTLSSSLFFMTVLSPSPSRSRLMIVVSSAFTMVVIGAATSVAAMQVKISLRIKWLLFLRLLDNLELFSLFRFRIPRRPKEPRAFYGEMLNAQAGSAHPYANGQGHDDCWITRSSCP